jgi:hypothetical protein
VNCGEETGELDARVLGREAPVDRRRGGYLPIANTPGLGVTLNPDALARYSHSEKLLDA